MVIIPFITALKKGYSGVALFTKIKPIQVFEGIGHEKFDNEGRVIGAEFDTFYVFGAYFPNGQMSEERLQYKLDFYQTFLTFVKSSRINLSLYAVITTRLTKK